ncbi:hypothetical protein Trydic_g21414 [Trypoxylus dichotomus]
MKAFHVTRRDSIRGTEGACLQPLKLSPNCVLTIVKFGVFRIKPAALLTRSGPIKALHAQISTGKAQELCSILQRSFPNAINVTVTDMSGGCGKLFKIFVECEHFRGLSILKQHRAVTEALREQINQFHGLRIETKVPDDKEENEKKK